MPNTGGAEGADSGANLADDVAEAASRFASMALNDPNPQVRTFAVQALKAMATRGTVRARTDGMTGLPNFAGAQFLFERLRRAMVAPIEHRHHRPPDALLVFVVDLADFKRVNDTLGWSVGTELLVEFAQLLERNLRFGDIAARQGGDEYFAILQLFDDDMGELTYQAFAVRIVQRLAAACAAFNNSDHEIAVAAREYGIATVLSLHCRSAVVTRQELVTRSAAGNPVILLEVLSRADPKVGERYTGEQ